jgi:hypothetical protein
LIPCITQTGCFRKSVTTTDYIAWEAERGSEIYYLGLKVLLFLKTLIIAKKKNNEREKKILFTSRENELSTIPRSSLGTFEIAKSKTTGTNFHGHMLFDFFT